MLKINKFFSVGIVSLSALTVSQPSLAEIVDSFERDNVFYLLDSDGGTNTLYSYDMASGETDISTLITISGNPTAVTFDGTTYFAAADNILWSINNEGTATAIRNVNSEVKELLVVDDYLIALLGDPENAIVTIHKVTGAPGALGGITPRLRDDFETISGILYDADNNRIIATLETPNDDSTQFVFSSLNTGTGELDASLSSLTGNHTGFGSPFYLDEFEMAVDSSGNVINFGTLPNATWPHGDIDQGATGNQITTYRGGPVATNSVIHSASDDTTAVYSAMTLDNSCNPVAVGGTRITRHASNGGDGLFIPPEGWLGTPYYYYDTEDAVHTISSDSGSVFLFSGSGSELSVEIIEDADFRSPNVPWRQTPYVPSEGNLTSASQNLSFALRDNRTIAMQVDEGCDHHVVFWDTESSEYTGFTSTFWPNATTGAYVTGQDRIYIAFNYENQKVIRGLSSTTPQSEDEESFAVDYEVPDPDDDVNLLVNGGDYLIASIADYIVSFDTRTSNELRDYTDGSTIDVVRLDEEDNKNDGDITDCCGTWTNAVYNSVRNEIYFTTSTGLYTIDFVGGVFSGANAAGDSAVQSPHYGTIQPVANTPYMSLNADGTRLFLDGQIYDTTQEDGGETIGLVIVDSVTNDADVGLFVGNTLYTVDLDSSILQAWLFDDGTGLLEDSATDTTLTGSIAVLLPIMEEGDTVPLTLADNGNGGLVVTVDGDSDNSATIGGGESETDTGGNSGGGTDSGTDQTDTGSSSSGSSSGSGCSGPGACVETSSGGGPIDLILLLGLTGLAARYRQKH